MPSNVDIKLTTESNVYHGSGYAHKCFPVRNIRKFKPDDGGAWLVEYKSEKERQLGTLIDDSTTSSSTQKKKSTVKIQSQNNGPIKTRDLSTSFLLKEFHLDDPSGLFSINISGKSLRPVKDEEFSLFGNVLYIEAGDNHLDVEAFKSFPKLEELHLQVNGICNINISHEEFLQLKRLDLSYNKLAEDALLRLGKLRNVKELTLRGCSLKNLPSEFARGYVVTSEDGDEKTSKAEQERRFPELEHLDLSENRLTDLTTFASLAGLRKLKTLNLSSNKISGIPNLRLLVSHRHFSVSPYDVKCNSPEVSSLKEKACPGSAENIIKAKEFCSLTNSKDVIPGTEFNNNNNDSNNNNIIIGLGMGDNTTKPTGFHNNNNIDMKDVVEVVDLSVHGVIGLPSDICDVGTFTVKEVDSLVTHNLDIIEESNIEAENAEQSIVDNLDNQVTEGSKPVTSEITEEAGEAGDNLPHNNYLVDQIIHNNLDGNEDICDDAGKQRPPNNSHIDLLEGAEDYTKLINVEPLGVNSKLLTMDFAKEINFTLDEDENSNSFKEEDSGEDIINNNLKVPFYSLKTLDISNNLVTQEDSLLALASWPALQDLKLWGNPLMHAFKGIPPVIAHHLRKMCGIKIHRKEPQNDQSHSIGSSIAKSAKSFRVKNNLPPIKRNNMMMIEAAIQKAVEEKEHKEEELLIEAENREEIKNDDDKEETPSNPTKCEETENVFLTQVDDEGIDVEKPNSPEIIATKQLIYKDDALMDSYTGYKELLKIDETYGPESDIHIPSTVYGCAESLRRMLKHPLVFKEGNYNRKRLKAEKKTKATQLPSVKKDDKILDALNFIRTKETTYQENLATVLDQFGKNSEIREKFSDTKEIVKRVQQKYDKVRLESLRPVTTAQTEFSRQSTRADKQSQDLILLRMKQGRIGDMYSSGRSTSTLQSRQRGATRTSLAPSTS